MAPCPFARLVPTEPYQLAILFLSIAALLHSATFIPASPLIYLIRSDFSSSDSSFVSSTAWFSAVGHCIVDSSSAALDTEAPFSRQCAYTFLGYDVEAILSNAGISTPGSSFFLTSSLVILHLLAVLFALVSIVAYQVIWLCHANEWRLHWSMYVCSMGNTLLAFVVSVVAFVYQCGFLSFVSRSHAATAGVHYSTTYGPTAYAAMWALFFELAASSVGFYSCIGGKYVCDGEELMDEEEALRLMERGEESEYCEEVVVVADEVVNEKY